MTTKQEISGWFEYGNSHGYNFMAVICDTFDYVDFPKFFKTRDELDQYVRSPGSMERVMETYDLNGNKDFQLSNDRNFV